MGAKFTMASLPQNIIKCMSITDRKSVGAQTMDEVQGCYDDAAERVLQRLCETELSRRGVEFLHLSFRAREKKGWPDLTFVIGGYPYAVELKSVNGKLSLDQIQCLERMERNGWKTAVIRSFDDFKKIISQEQGA